MHSIHDSKISAAKEQSFTNSLQTLLGVTEAMVKNIFLLFLSPTEMALMQ
jgi:hypothetical protein